MIPPDYFKYIQDNAEAFRAANPKTGPLWTIKQRFVMLYDEVILLRNRVQELENAKVEAIPMKIILSPEELEEIIKNHLNEHVVKKPVAVEGIEFIGLDEEPIDCGSIIVVCEPKAEKPQ